MSSLCAPAMLYLIFSIIVIILMFVNKYKNETIAVKSLFIILWTLFLNFLCEKGLSGLSWFLVLLPFILFILMILMIREMVESHLRKQK
jgi:NADH:ubiquinone oxidoreductase subunit 4 (subunit M)